MSSIHEINSRLMDYDAIPYVDPNMAYNFITNPGSDIIGLRVGFVDHVGVTQYGIVVYAIPHKSEEGVFYLGIRTDRPELNNIQITTPNGIIMVGEYTRSDNCWELGEA